MRKYNNIQLFITQQKISENLILQICNCKLLNNAVQA